MFSLLDQNENVRELIYIIYSVLFIFGICEGSKMKVILIVLIFKYILLFSYLLNNGGKAFIVFLVNKLTILKPHTLPNLINVIPF